MLKTVLIWKYMVQLTVLGIWLSDGAGVALLCLGGNIIGFVLVMLLWRASLPSAHAAVSDHQGGASE